MANTWSPRTTSSANTWFVSDTALGPYQDSPIVSYRILYPVYATSVSPTWQVASEVGSIQGSAVLPFGSVTEDAVPVYDVFNPVEKDASGNYKIVQYAEDIRTINYRVLNGVTVTATSTYNMGGKVERDASGIYRLVTGVELETPVVEYDIKGSALADASSTYFILTSPLTAGDNRTVTYNVINSVLTDVLCSYVIRTSVTKDTVQTYGLKNGVSKDQVVTFSVDGSAYGDQTILYQIVGRTTATNDAFLQYNVNALVQVVPNIVGFPLPKAKKKIEQAGFVLGEITYE